MSVLHAIVLGLVQGLTEFLPVSSSGHLTLLPWLFGWDDFSGNEALERAFDVALHLGTLVGAVAYLRRDIMRYLGAGAQWLVERGPLTGDARVVCLLVATAVPTAVIGVVILVVGDDPGDRIWLVAVCLAAFGVLLRIADGRPGERQPTDLRFGEAFLLGAVQGLAFQPGVSRAGVALTTARWLRIDRAEAARFVFLMSLPVIAGAGLVKLGDLSVPGGWWPAFALGTAAAALSGWVGVGWMLRLLSRVGFGGFMAYRLVVGATVLVLLATSWR